MPKITMPDEVIGGTVSNTKEYYDGPADHIYRSVWEDNIHLGVPCSEDCPHPEAMEHTNELMAKAAGLRPGMRVLDLGCGYGSTARYLANNHHVQVIGTNISEKELALARERTTEADLEHLLTFEQGDFHDLTYLDRSFDVVWSQDAFLHGYDKALILSECKRVLVPGGTLAFTDILVKKGTGENDRRRIYDRVKSPEIWDIEDYRDALSKLGFQTPRITDWSSNVARSYAWVRDTLEAKRKALLPRIGAETIDRTLDALTFWVDSAEQDKIGWALFVATKPNVGI